MFWLSLVQIPRANDSPAPNVIDEGCSAMVTAFQQKMAAEEAQQQYRHRVFATRGSSASSDRDNFTYAPNKSASRSPVGLPNLQLAAVDSLASGCCSLNSANKKADAP
jgi:hypothetical protein